MAADENLTTDTASVMEVPAAKLKLSPVKGTPATRLTDDRYNDKTLEVGDKIRLRIVQGGSTILPAFTKGIPSGEYTMDMGLYEVAADRGLGAVVDADNIWDGLAFTGAGVPATGVLPPVQVPKTKNEYWVVAEVTAVTTGGTSHYFHLCVNDAQ